MDMPETGQAVVASRYRLTDRPLGRGGMGVVWRAHDDVLGRDVALKQFAPPEGLDPQDLLDLRARFRQEARSAARLHHPGIIAIYDIIEAEADHHLWLVMHLVEGCSLHERIRDNGPLAPDEVARIGLTLVDALEAAHAEGVVHRDVTPRNVLLADDGAVVLGDFGIAAAADGTRLTGTGNVIGTPGYMAPERLNDEPATPASDLWSLGATLYQAVEGRSPFKATQPGAVVKAILKGEMRRPERAGRLERILLDLLATDPSQRPGAADVRHRLLATENDEAKVPEPAEPAVTKVTEPTPPGADTGGSLLPDHEAPTVVEVAPDDHPPASAGQTRAVPTAKRVLGTARRWLAATRATYNSPVGPGAPPPTDPGEPSPPLEGDDSPSPEGPRPKAGPPPEVPAPYITSRAVTAKTLKAALWGKKRTRQALVRLLRGLLLLGPALAYWNAASLRPNGDEAGYRRLVPYAVRERLGGWQWLDDLVSDHHQAGIAIGGAIVAAAVAALLAGLWLVVTSLRRLRPVPGTLLTRRLTINDRGIDLRPSGSGQMKAGPMLPWSRIREATVVLSYKQEGDKRVWTDALVVRLAHGDHERPWGSTYASDVGYILCELGDVRARPSAAQAAIDNHTSYREAVGQHEVVLVGPGPNSVTVTTTVQSLAGLSWASAKKWVEKKNQVVVHRALPAEAEAARDALQRAGATVRIEPPIRLRGFGGSGTRLM